MTQRLVTNLMGKQISVATPGNSPRTLISLDWEEDNTQEDKMYFAYGSNMSKQQIVERLGEYGNLDGELVASLQGFEICFHKISKSQPGYGFATIIKDPNCTVHGVLIKLNSTQISVLDRFEGIKSKPPHYEKKGITVMTKQGEAVDAFTYIAHPKRIDKELGPSKDYLQTILTGAKEHGLEESYIEKLISFGSHQ